MDSYREIQQATHLDGFLFDHNITDQSDMAIRNARDFFGGFSVMPGYNKYPKTERPMAIRYAPLHYDAMLKRSDIQPIYAVGVSAEENRGSEGKWAGPSTNRQTFFTQIDFFSAEKAMEEGVYTHLDVLFGLRPMTDEDVRKVRHGEARVDTMPTVDQVLPVLNDVDRNHVLAAASALYQGKCVAIVLEEGVPFNRRAKELLLNVYSLLQPMDAYRTGYSTYQNPKTIASVMTSWSVKVFVVPGDRNPENGADPAHDIPAGIAVVDMRKPCAPENTQLWAVLEKWLELPWQQRLEAMARAMNGDKMLLNRSDEKENAFWRNEFLKRSKTFFMGVDALDNWDRRADLSNLNTLQDVYREYIANIQPWLSIPGAMDVFRAALNKESERRKNEKKRGNQVTLLEIGKLTADAYADLVLNQDPARKQELEKLYLFGEKLNAPDPRTAWSRCERHQASIRQEQVDKEVIKLKDEYDGRITALEEKKAEYSRVKQHLKLSEDDNDEQVVKTIGDALLRLKNTITTLQTSNTGLTERNAVLDNHIASLYPNQAPGEDHAARIAELLVAEDIISKCCQQLDMVGRTNQEIADRVGTLLDSERKLHSCIETLKFPEGSNQDPVSRIQNLLEAEVIVFNCYAALHDVESATQDPVGKINALKQKNAALADTNKNLCAHFERLCPEERYKSAFGDRVNMLLAMEDGYLKCQKLLSTEDYLSPDPVAAVEALKKKKQYLESQKEANDGYLAQLGVNSQNPPGKRIQQLLNAEEAVKAYREKLKIEPHEPHAKLGNRIDSLIRQSDCLKECAKVFDLEKDQILDTKTHICEMRKEEEVCREELARCGYPDTKLHAGVIKLANDHESLVVLTNNVDNWAENQIAPPEEWRDDMPHAIPETKSGHVNNALTARIARFLLDLRRSWSTKKTHLIISFATGVLVTLVIVGFVNLLLGIINHKPDLTDPTVPETTEVTTTPTTEPTTEPPTEKPTEVSTEEAVVDSDSWLTQTMVDELKRMSGESDGMPLIKTFRQSGLENLGETYGQVPLALFSDKESAEGEGLPACYVLAMTGVPENKDGLYAYLTYEEICIAVKHSNCTDHSLLLAVRLMTEIVDLDNRNHDEIQVYVRLDKETENEPFAQIEQPIRNKATNKWLWDVTNCYTRNDTKKYSGTEQMKYQPLLVLEGEGWFIAYSNAEKINNDPDEQEKLRSLYNSNCDGWSEFWYFYEAKTPVDAE